MSDTDLHPIDSPPPADFRASECAVRLARPEDQAAIELLFQRGSQDGYLRDNDTGSDIRHLQDAYFSEGDASGFWVAEYHGTVVGMIGVQRTADASVDIRRLRVATSFRRRGVGSRLMETAIDFCRERGYLKVVLDVRVDRAPAIAIFEKFGFQHTKERDIDGRRTLDFYLDLYSETPPGPTT